MKFPNPFKFLRALCRFAERPEVAPEWVQQERHRRCMSCPFNEKGQCQKCTCYIPFKVLLSTEVCPDRRWDEYFSDKKSGL